MKRGWQMSRMTRRIASTLLCNGDENEGVQSAEATHIYI